MKKPAAKAILLKGHSKLTVAASKLVRFHTDANGKPVKPCDCKKTCMRKARSVFQDTPLEPHENPLLQMKAPHVMKHWRWAAYQNQALDSMNHGHVIFLAFGAGCTYENDEALPAYAPDGTYGLGWKYLHVGYVNLETGDIEEDLKTE